jgi:hypothetical protein
MPMNGKEFYTTGEVARLLKISQSTISRMFDRGALFGKQNPITGKRVVSRESIATLMKHYNQPVDGFTVKKKRILLGTPEQTLLSSMQKMFSGNDRVQIERFEFGGDVLIQCSKASPDLLVLDEGLSDIPCPQIIQSLRRTEEHKNLKILCWSESQDVSQCAKWGADGVLSKDDLARGGLKDELCLLLDISGEEEAPVHTFEHRRRWPRASLDLPAKIWVYRLSKSHVREGGEAKLDNVSLGGAHLSYIQLEKKTIPSEPFRMLLEVDREPLNQWRVHCKVVRLESNGGLEAGLQFVRLSKSKQAMIEAIVQKQGAPQTAPLRPR